MYNIDSGHIMLEIEVSAFLFYSEILENENAFLKKYFALRKKCEQIQQVR
jgi:hypothetical protein